MTLNQDELTTALHEALKTADPPCTRFCVTGAEADEHGYHIWHNAIGRGTDEQYIRDNAVLALTTTYLTTKLKAWVERLHKTGEPMDLNAAMAMATGARSERWPFHQVDYGRIARVIIKPEYLAVDAAGWPTGGTLP